MMETLASPARIGGPSAEAGRLVLASASRTRRTMLENAGLTFEVEAARVDEAGVKASLSAEGATAAQVAETLAELKALRVSPRRPGALVIGADQMLECEGRWFDKPSDRGQAAAQLAALGNRTHELVCCACVALDGQRVWHRVDRARLTVRPLSAAFIEAYLDAVGERALDSVGAYQLEGLGAQLFSKIEGDFFTILGLPLLPLMEFLRDRGILAR